MEKKKTKVTNFFDESSDDIDLSELLKHLNKLSEEAAPPKEGEDSEEELDL